MRAEAIVLGLDMAAGRAAWENLSDALGELGLTLGSVTSVGVRETEVEEAIRHALGRSFLVIIYGAKRSGPALAAATGHEEDLAKKIISRVLGRRLILQSDLLGKLGAAYRNLSLDTPAGFEKLALLPSGARAIEDAQGAPSGFYMEHEGRYILYLPRLAGDMAGAVPGEFMKLLVRNRGLRRWERRRVLRSYGLEEAKVRELLADMLGGDGCLDFATGLDGVDIKVTVRSDIAEKADRALEETCARIAAKLGDYVYGIGAFGMEQEAARLLIDRQLTIALAESCTGGLLAKRLTDVPGSSAFMERGAVTYSDRSKEEMLGVPAKTLAERGAVSRETAQAMAEGIRWSAKADIGLSITGIAGPTGGTQTKPVGLVYIGLATPEGVDVKGFNFPGSRDEIRYASSQRALDLLRRYLIS